MKPPALVGGGNDPFLGGRRWSLGNTVPGILVAKALTI